MAENSVQTSSLEEILDTLRLRKEEIGASLPFFAIGAEARIRITPGVEQELFDLAIICSGHADHEAHVAEVERMLTLEELTGRLMLLVAANQAAMFELMVAASLS